MPPAITPVMCPGWVSTCNCFTSKITNPNVPFSDHILLPSSVFKYFNYDHPLTSSTFSQSISSSSPFFFLLLIFSSSLDFCPVISVTLLEFSFAYVFLLLSINKAPSQTDATVFCARSPAASYCQRSHTCIWPTSNASFKFDNSPWSIHLPILYSDYIKSLCYAKSLQSCLTLCDPTDGSPTGSPVPGILQARTLEWVAISFSNAWKWKVKVKSLSHVPLLATPSTAAHQAPLSMGFSRQEYWSGMPLPSPHLQTSYLLSLTLLEGEHWSIRREPPAIKPNTHDHCTVPLPFRVGLSALVQGQLSSSYLIPFHLLGYLTWLIVLSLLESLLLWKHLGSNQLFNKFKSWDET